MIEKLRVWEAVKREMKEYQFIVGAESQPKWDVLQKIAINAAVSGRFKCNTSSEEYVEAASTVIEADARGVDTDSSWMTDAQGRRLGRQIPLIEAYTPVLEALRVYFGDRFVPNLNVLHGTTFDMCTSPARRACAKWLHARRVIWKRSWCRPSRRWRPPASSQSFRFTAQVKSSRAF